MIDLLRYIRFFVFLVFVVSSAITTSVAVWNISIVESTAFFASATKIDTYLIILGALGLLLIFPIIFLEIYGRNTTLGKVWFELLWVGLFGVMELVGGSLTISQSNAHMCAEKPVDKTGAVPDQLSPCQSAQVLIAFTWIPALLFLGYDTLLLILAYVKSKEDKSVWTSCVRTFPWMRGVHSLKSAPTSPNKPMFRNKTPVIYAPRPRRAGAPVLAYRSGIDSEYDIESYKPSSPPAAAPRANIMSVERPQPPIPAPTAEPVFQIRPLPQYPEQMHSTPFYNSAVQRVIQDQAGPSVPAPPPAQLGQVRRLPASPPPLGDWPRLDATSRPRSKKKALPSLPSSSERTHTHGHGHGLAAATRPNTSRSQASLPPDPEPQPLLHALPAPPPRRPAHTRRQNPPPPPPPLQSISLPSNSSDHPYLPTTSSHSAAPLQPRRARPSGPRRSSSDNHDESPTSARKGTVPPPLDLSKISSHRSNYPSGFR